MKPKLFCSLAMCCLLFGCAHEKGHEERAQHADGHHKHAHQSHAAHAPKDGEHVDVPAQRTKRDHLASAGDETPARDADNTAVNDRDRDGSNMTPLDQGNDEIDIDLTQSIRKAVIADDALSFTAKNVKIITLRGHVTLRGPVNSRAEKDTIFKTAVSRAGIGHVSNELEVDDD